jgi:hypothetical protein
MGEAQQGQLTCCGMVEIFVQELSIPISASWTVQFLSFRRISRCFTYIIGRLADVTKRDGNRDAGHSESRE